MNTEEIWEHLQRTGDQVAALKGEMLATQELLMLMTAELSKEQRQILSKALRRQQQIGLDAMLATTLSDVGLASFEHQAQLFAQRLCTM